MKVYVLCSTDVHQADAYVEGVYSSHAEASAAAEQAEIAGGMSGFPAREYAISEHEFGLIPQLRPNRQG